MATIGKTYLDLIDLLKRSESDDAIRVADIIMLLKQNNSIMDDALTVEANLGTRHRTTRTDNLPAGSWGQLYKGIEQSVGKTSQVEDTTGFYQQLSSVDTRLLDLAGNNRNAVRLSEAQMHLENVSQQVTAALIYANSALEAEKPTGFAPRFASLSGATGGQIVDAGGTGSDNTSAWFVTWSDEACQVIYPSGTQGGVQREDKGEQRVLDSDSKPYFVEEELFTQHVGLAVRDYRQVARVANIDVSDLQAGSVDIYKFFRKAFWRIRKHNMMGARMAIYCNSDVMEALDADSTPTTSTSASFVRLRPTEVDGMEVMSYRGIPVRQVDQILNTESQIT